MGYLAHMEAVSGIHLMPWEDYICSGRERRLEEPVHKSLFDRKAQTNFLETTSLKHSVRERASPVTMFIDLASPYSADRVVVFPSKMSKSVPKAPRVFVYFWYI